LAVPTVGFVTSLNGTALTPILGIPGAARLGSALPAAGSTALYVAPRGAYLLASAPGASVSIALLRPSALQNGLELNPLSGTLVSPDLIVFSPGGSAAALYSKQSNSVQVLAGLPNSPHLGSDFPVAATLLQLAVSDDGQSVLAQEDGGLVRSLTGGESSYKVQGEAPITFLPGSHDAVLADASTDSLVQLPAAGGSAMLGSGLSAPDALAVTADGGTILAGSASRKNVWTLNRASGKSQEYPLAGSVKSLRSMAATDTFLITYQDGSYGLLSWRNNQLSMYFVGVFRSGAK
jgi:hypothetical protein